MQKFCYSCGAPVDMPDFKGPSENFCKYCTDETGELKSRETVKAGISQYLKGWQPDLTEDQAEIRADHYMKAMPAWAE